MKTSNTGPNNYLEDIPTAFCQMGHNPIIIVATIGLNQFLVLILYVSFFLVGNVFSIAFFNFAGISVTKELSSTTRMVLDSGRTLVIWAVTLALGWQKFNALQVVGFVLLVIGKWTFLFVDFFK